MKSLGKSVVCVAACVSLLGACGPAVEGEELEGTDPTAATAEKPKGSGVPDPTAFELAEPRMVHAQTFLGDLGRVVGTPVATYPSINTATNQWSVSCNGGSSRDIAYLWTVPATGSYTFNTYGSNFDTVMQIRNYKATSEVMGCNDDASSSRLQSKITLTGLVRGVSLLIIIEGYAAEYGNTQLNIIKNN